MTKSSATSSIIRWIFLLPAAFSAYMLAGIFIGLCYWLYARIADSTDVIVATLLLLLLRGIIGGYVYMMVGTEIAPAKKKEASIILLVLISILCGGLALSTHISGNRIGTIEALCSTIGAGLGLFHLRKRG